MYQWTHKSQVAPTQNTPGKLETSVAWPHANDKKTSPTKTREGESKIPKLLATSTPKARIQLVSSLVTMSDHSPLTLLNGTETDNNRVNELKQKMSKCETIQEMFLLIKSFLGEYNMSMQSSESSSNSGIFNGSALNGSDSTVFERSMETTVFNVLEHQKPSPTKTQTPPRPVRGTIKSRTSPSTPTGTAGRSDPKRFRRNMSVDSVTNSPPKPVEAVNGVACKRCIQLLTSPAKTKDKRMVDKATVMDVEPIVFPPATELKSAETQTEADIKDEDIVEVESRPAPAPPPPPPMMNIPPPPPPPSQNTPGEANDFDSHATL